ncbi:hypothetical protein [Flavobacterium notoginsengisoli]|uniref:hypothetical protein n=1 Tax=Flavobacterium notoginsengisoli TaxID=1478199 RepID=UPI00362C02F1
MRKLFLFLCLFLSFKNYAQDSLKKDSISIASYINSQNVLKKNPKILVIEDKKWVDLIQSYSNSKEKFKTDRIYENLKKKSIGERFNYDDNTSIKEIISIINTGNNDSINRLFKDIVFNDRYAGTTDPNRRKTIDPELRSLFFKCLKNPQLESQTAKMLSILQIEDYEKPIKELLLSGQSDDEIKLFCALHYADFGDVIDYFFNSLINNKKYTSEDIFRKHNLIYSLNSNYFNNTKIDSATRKKIITYSVELLKKFPLDSVFIQRHRESSNWIPASPGNYWDQFDVISFLFSTGDEAVIPVIENLKTLGFKDNLTFKFLKWKLGVDTTKENFNALLNNCRFYNFTVNELFLKGLLTMKNEQLFVDVLSKIEKPLPKMNSSNEWSDCLPYGFPEIFNLLEKKEFDQIINKAIKKDSNKQELTKNFNKFRNRNIIYALNNSEHWWKNLPYSWIHPYNYENSDTLRIPKRLLDLSNSLKEELNAKGYKVFSDLSPFDFISDDLNTSRDKLNAFKAQSNKELNNLNFFIDSKYFVKKQYKSTLEEDKYEYRCFIFFNDIVYSVTINNETDDTKLIFNEISEVLLKSVKSPNRFIEINPLNQQNLGYYIFGNPKTAKSILTKYNFTN